MDKKCGIYKIENKVNNKVYIGQSVNMKTRWNGHRRDLKNNKHSNYHLQSSYNKYREDNFEYSVVEYCNRNDLNKRELFWINQYNSADKKDGYNIMKPNADATAFIMSKETREKQSQAGMIYSKDELISYLQEYYYMFGKALTTREIDDLSTMPSSGTFTFAFGNYKNTLIEADLYEECKFKPLFDRIEYTKEDVLVRFSNFIEKYNRFPTTDEIKKPSNHNLVTNNIIIKLFDSTDKLKEELGYIESRDSEFEDAIEGLKQLYKQEGYITSRTIDKSSLTRSTSYYTHNFNSLLEAYSLAGIYTKEDVLEKLLDFVKVHDRVPTKRDIDNYKLPSYNIINNYFTKDKLNVLLGFDKEDLKQKENIEALSKLKLLSIQQGFICQDSINQSILTKSVKFYCNRFGSLKNACINADIPSDLLKLKCKPESK